MKIAVGSGNPVKLEVARECFSRFFDKVEIISVKADSNVPSQPIGEETMEGAINRARESLKAAKADFGVGMEGGLIELGGRSYFTACFAIADGSGNMHTGTSGWWECPKGILPEIRAGRELGEITERLTGIKNVKQKQGGIGVFTKGAVDRKALYVHGLYMCLVPYLNKELFGLR
ncbi:MAG: inosine/xanthosine triphosphatase [Candidatus Aenigmarchaeota archaeon]|nr:inosine/xanthosine triphosphatase [Candidatus Aenigmarchaeota archaeon]